MAKVRGFCVTVVLVLISGCAANKASMQLLPEPISKTVKVVDRDEIRRTGNQQQWAGAMYGAVGALMFQLLDGGFSTSYHYTTVDVQGEKNRLKLGRDDLAVGSCYIVKQIASCYLCDVPKEMSVEKSIPCSDDMNAVKTYQPPADLTIQEKPNSRPN
jgi:hypothetical protein